ncbi:MAG: hypothetical protein ACUVT2_11085, partial [Thiobacillaceae bacterium]
MKRLAAVCCLLLLTGVVLAAATEETVELTSGTAVLSHRYADHGAGAVVLWFTGLYGRLEEEHRAAAHLAGSGMEVWLTDWLAPYFLPQVASSVAEVPDADLAEWLERMHKRHAGRPLVLVASGHT